MTATARRDAASRVRALRSPIARTPRLELVLPHRRYAGEVVRLLNDRSVVRWTLRIPFPYRAADATAFYARWRKGWRAATNLPLQVVRRADGRLVGGFGLHRVDPEHSSAEVGYWIGRPFRRQGYGREALEAVTRLAFRRLGLYRLEARVFPGNAASSALLLAAGFRYEGRLRAAVRKGGRPRDELVYGRLRDDPVRSSRRAVGRRASAGGPPVAPTK